MHETIVAFWFSPEPGAERPEWFHKDAAFDALIRTRFGSAIETALAGGFRDWESTARGALARVLLLDQFTRNAYRGTPRSFAGDVQALATADAAIAAGHDRSLLPVERWFLYLPFEHSESMAVQERSVALFARLAAETGLASPLEWAEKHAVIIRRFRRFPHRNEILGRPSTPEEVAFLREAGSRF